MITFFRKIRQRLLSQSKFSNYLLYAIGEIGLVMIGILLALQVNSYYRNIQDRKLEKSLLKELHRNIKEDSLQIHYDLSQFKRIRENALYLERIIEQKLPYNQKVDTAFAAISIFNVSEANYVPFEKVKTLKNGIIQNDSLFNLLSNYYNFSKYLAQTDRYFENGAYFRKEIYPRYAKAYSFGNYAKVADYQQFLNSNEVKVAIGYCRNDAFFYYNRSKVRLKQAGDLIKFIKDELKHFD